MKEINRNIVLMPCHPEVNVKFGNDDFKFYINGLLEFFGIKVNDAWALFVFDEKGNVIFVKKISVNEDETMKLIESALSNQKKIENQNLTNS